MLSLVDLDGWLLGLSSRSRTGARLSLSVVAYTILDVAVRLRRGSSRDVLGQSFLHSCSFNRFDVLATNVTVALVVGIDELFKRIRREVLLNHMIIWSAA